MTQFISSNSFFYSYMCAISDIFIRLFFWLNKMQCASTYICLINSIFPNCLSIKHLTMFSCVVFPSYYQKITKDHLYMSSIMKTFKSVKVGCVFDASIIVQSTQAPYGDKTTVDTSVYCT